MWAGHRWQMCTARYVTAAGQVPLEDGLTVQMCEAPAIAPKNEEVMWAGRRQPTLTPAACVRGCPACIPAGKCWRQGEDTAALSVQSMQMAM